MEIDDKGSVSDGHHTFDELYEHRHWLFVALAWSHCHRAWISRNHHDGSPSYEGWFVAGIDFPSGQISYHLPNRMWDEMAHFATEQDYSPWDGHTSGEVVERLKQSMLFYGGEK